MSRSAVTTANLAHYQPLTRVEVERRARELVAEAADSWLRSLIAKDEVAR